MNAFKLYGLVHLPPLPGSPSAQLSLSEIVDWALSDAKCLWESQFDGLIIENFGDTPFWPDRVEAHTIAQMAIIANAIRMAKPSGFKIGINVLRNDAIAALAIAHSVSADFIRVNVHSGAAWTDQGLIQGQARQTLNYRQSLGGGRIQIAADVLVKHAEPAGVMDPVQLAKDTALRGGADALIFTGQGTGQATDLSVLKQVQQYLPSTPLWIGSGLNPNNLVDSMRVASAGIIGTYLHDKGDIKQPLSPSRCREIQAIRCAEHG